MDEPTEARLRDAVDTESEEPVEDELNERLGYEEALAEPKIDLFARWTAWAKLVDR